MPECLGIPGPALCHKLVSAQLPHAKVRTKDGSSNVQLALCYLGGMC